MPVHAENWCEKERHYSGDFEYILLDDQTAAITGGMWIVADLAIPETLDGIPVTKLYDIGYWGTVDLVSVTIPNSVTEIESNPFTGASTLAEIRVSPDHPTLEVRDGVLFSKPDHRLICYPCGRRGTAYTVPEGTVPPFFFYSADLPGPADGCIIRSAQ